MGIDKFTRAHVEIHLVEELHSRRFKSSDLIECLFGSLIDITTSAEILGEFLKMSVLTVKKEVDGVLRDIPKKEFKAACKDAAIHANEAITPSQVSPPNSYRWTWGLPTDASEAAVALFLNVVAIAAHAASIRIPTARPPPLPRLRLITLPNPQRAVPLFNDSATQDCRPDVVAFDLAAFCQAPKIPSPLQFPLLDDSPFTFIRTRFPKILKFSTEELSANGLAIRQFEQWFDEQARRTHLDMTKFCWPEVELTAEAKFSDLGHSLVQELVYMRQQRRTQPWMRSILGLVVTAKVVGVLRADTLGVEQCVFDRACSRGVLDTVRICLGLVWSDAFQRGQHPAFQLFPTRTLGPPHLKPNLSDVFSTNDPMVKYRHRTVRFITLRGDRVYYPRDSTTPETRFYVHHLVQDMGSLVGRCGRIFCVSRESESESGVRTFVGPYALKFYNAECGSDCFKYDLIQVARDAQARNVLLPTCEWYYGDALSARGFPPEVVKTDARVAQITNRHEVFAQSDFKRLLVQSVSYEEFAKAFIDFVDAIESLAENDLVHRDFSIGNVLLSKDIPCSPSFLSEAATSAQAILNTPVAFKQRTLEGRVGGLVHDFDMAGRVHPLPEVASGDADEADPLMAALARQQAERPAPPAQLEGPPKGFRTGTPPFMAIRLLRDGPPHRVSDDLHSLLFVLALFFWSYPKFLTDTPFPSPVATQGRKWPPEVLQWANRPVASSLSQLGDHKAAFFRNPDDLMKTVKRTLDGDLWTEEPRVLRFFSKLYGALWKKSTEGPYYIDRLRPMDLELVLTKEMRRP
ncbi:hypothetical protein C8J57DRAFT_1323767 [Mycena rebaudengoi]|nr:hypothetical protein C8J57DRAFT_1323767 [Mycena rebaudengoi]